MQGGIVVNPTDYKKGEVKRSYVWFADWWSFMYEPRYGQ